MIRFPVVDCHVHIRDITTPHVPWLDDVPFLNRTFLLPDYNAACGPLSVEKMVFVQCECDPAQYRQEVAWIADKARSDSRRQGIVARAPLQKGEKVRGELAELKRNPLVKGIRRIIQFEKDLEFCLQPDCAKAVKLLAEFGFTFDMCLSHLHAANPIKLVDQCPDVRFIPDHIGKPDIRGHRLEPGRSEIKSLAAFPNVCCEVSSLATQADHERWTCDALRPYVERIFECFGFDRTVYAGDLPVSSQAQTLPQCVETTECFLPQATERQQRREPDERDMPERYPATRPFDHWWNRRSAATGVGAFRHKRSATFRESMNVKRRRSPSPAWPADAIIPWSRARLCPATLPAFPAAETPVPGISGPQLIETTRWPASLAATTGIIGRAVRRSAPRRGKAGNRAAGRAARQAAPQGVPARARPTHEGNRLRYADCFVRTGIAAGTPPERSWSAVLCSVRRAAHEGGVERPSLCVRLAAIRTEQRCLFPGPGSLDPRHNVPCEWRDQEGERILPAEKAAQALPRVAEKRTHRQFTASAQALSAIVRDFRLPDPDAARDRGSATRGSTAGGAPMKNERIYTPPPYPGKPRARRLTADAPMPERHLVLEDFEGRGEDALHAIWYQWGELTYRLDPEHKCRGSYGCTHEVGGVNTSFFAFPPHLPFFSCAGMNAWRLWAKGDGSGKSATFFIKDGSQEVYCWVIPEFLRDTQPYVLEVPFGAYDYIYREHDRVFDPDGCGEFGYWITGPCRFSIDDIALVHDPSLPDFFGTPAALRPREE